MIPESEKLKAIGHAMSRYPEESCGFIVNGQYLAKDNIHPNPKDHFAIADAEYPLRGLEAVIHSHPCGTEYPTYDDQKGQIATNVPWGIVVIDEHKNPNLFFYGEGVEKPPLLGRRYRWGPSGTDGGGDCFALLKDYYQEVLGICLPEYPREYKFWEKGQNPYLESYLDYGFIEVPMEKADIHDLVFMKISSEIVNHVGVIYDSAHIIHHPSGHDSRRSLLGHWQNKITHFLRYNKDGGIPDDSKKGMAPWVSGGAFRTGL